MKFSRRDALLWLTGGCLAGSGMACLGPIAGYVWGPGRALAAGGSATGPWPVGTTDDLPVGSGRVVETPRGPAIIVRTGEDEVTALGAVCPHLGCLVRWKEATGEVICPCHAARFDTDGKVLGGPATSGLPRLEARIEDDEISCSWPSGDGAASGGS